MMIKIIEKDINELVPYENNARINDKAVDIVANSIQEFGFKNPCIIDTNNVLIAGHTRVLACKKLGISKVPCIVADDLTEDQIKAFRIADNSSAQIAEWDMEKLMKELEDIEYDMSKFGLSEQLDSIQKIIDDQKEPEEDEYEEPENLEPKAKLGDIYQLGNHRLMCGSSTEKADIEKLLNGNKMDMIFTDPPYNASYKSRGEDETLRKGIMNDNMSNEQFTEFIQGFMSSISLSIKDGGSIYICCNWKDSYPRMFFECLSNNINVSNCIVWNKKSGGMGWQDYRYQYEFIIYGFNNKSSHNFYGDRTETDIWECSREVRQNYVHPTQKPIEIPSRAIRNSSKSGQNVLDLFGGSGSTLIACEQLNRNCYMMELDPHYVDVIIDRWEKLTGEKAVKIC